MTYVLSGILVVLSLLLLITLCNLFTAPRLRRAPLLQTTPFVSVLIPARNEALKIANGLHDLLAQDYPSFEILVLNDGSTDETAAVVQRFAQAHPQVRLISGEPLPSGWLGKNWACHQLGRQARGELFIFTDADLRYAPLVIAHTVAWMQKHRLGMLSAFSQHITRTLPEKLIVPLLDMFVYSYLPLWLTYLSRDPALAAANGHWLAFTRAAYTRLGGHEHVRGEIVEDVELMRHAKQSGEAVLTLCGKGEIFGRMYENLRGVWAGYSKNLFGLVRYRTIPFFMLLLLLAAIHVLPYALLAFEAFARPAAYAVALNLLLRLLLALGFGHPLWASVILHPLAIMLMLALGVNSYRWHRAGKVTWKQRTYASRLNLQ